jgi:ribosomal protein S21
LNKTELLKQVKEKIGHYESYLMKLKKKFPAARRKRAK